MQRRKETQAGKGTSHKASVCKAPPREKKMVSKRGPEECTVMGGEKGNYCLSQNPLPSTKTTFGATFGGESSRSIGSIRKKERPSSEKIRPEAPFKK